MDLRFLILVFFIFTLSLNSYCQEIPENVPEIFYRNEKSLGFQLNTNGWGLGYRYGSRINYFEKQNYEIDFSIIKHPKEIKSSSYYSSNSFVFGKLNSVFDLRIGYGKQNEIHSKRDPGSIAIRYFYSFGPSIAIQKPIYYEIADGFDVQIEKFTDVHSPDEIKGKASFFEGFDEINVIPSAYIKTGFNFEFSQRETIIHALEAGIMFQAFLNDLEIMDVDDNQQFYFTLFVSYRFGKIVNAQEISEDYLKKRKKRIKLFN
ncbi:MAG: hypothetical protein GQ564_13680 [Bacteroidales bacterium]|nr:hypothetical protein [Bacteroidales bacterium]